MPDRHLRGLGWGLNGNIPATATAAWGARLIWPDDLLHDRQDLVADSADTKAALIEWLNGGAIRAALTEARRMADAYELTGSEDRLVTLFEDEDGVIRGNPRASYGYLYVAGWLKG